MVGAYSGEVCDKSYPSRLLNWVSSLVRYHRKLVWKVPDYMYKAIEIQRTAFSSICMYRTARETPQPLMPSYIQSW